MMFLKEQAHELLQLIDWSYSLSKNRKNYMDNTVDDFANEMPWEEFMEHPAYREFYNGGSTLKYRRVM